MSTLRVSNIEAKADASSPTIDEKVKVTSSQGRVLVQIDGKTAGITSIGINTTSPVITVDANQNVTFARSVTSSSGVSTFSSGINVGTGASISSPATNVLALGTNNIEAVRINSSNQIGIGTDNPDKKLVVKGSGGNFVAEFANTNNASNNNGVYINVQNTASTTQALNVGSGGNTSLIVQGDGNLKLGTAGTKVLNSSGNPILQQTGSVLQVVHTDFTTSGTITASSDTNISGFSASITPSSTSSKILAIVHFTGLLDCDGRLKLKRNTTIVRDNLLGSDRSGGSTAGWSYYDSYTVCASYLDSPGLTSSITYQISAEATGCGSNVYYNRDPSGSNNNGRSGITLLEIAG